MYERNGIIYKATSPSGKHYIGQTTVALKTRKYGHLMGSKRYDHKFARAIRKYGIEAFNWCILHHDIPEKYLNTMEVFTIVLYNSYLSGYNSTLGGEQTCGENNPMFGRKHSVDSKKKMSKNRQGLTAGPEHHMFNKKHSAMSKQKISENRKGVSVGKNNHFYGRTHSLETKQRISKANAKLDINMANEIRKKYKTKQYTYNRLSKEYDVSVSTVGLVINNKVWTIDKE